MWMLVRFRPRSAMSFRLSLALKSKVNNVVGTWYRLMMVMR